MVSVQVCLHVILAQGRQSSFGRALATVSARVISFSASHMRFIARHAKQDFVDKPLAHRAAWDAFHSLSVLHALSLHRHPTQSTIPACAQPFVLYRWMLHNDAPWNLSSMTTRRWRRRCSKVCLVSSTLRSDLTDQGDGEFDSDDQLLQREEDAEQQPAFAPRSLGLRERLKQRLGRPLKIAVPGKGPVAKMQDVCTVRCTPRDRAV